MSPHLEEAALQQREDDAGAEGAGQRLRPRHAADQRERRAGPEGRDHPVVTGKHEPRTPEASNKRASAMSQPRDILRCHPVCDPKTSNVHRSDGQGRRWDSGSGSDVQGLSSDSRSADVLLAVAVFLDRQRQPGVDACHDGEVARLAPGPGALHRLHLR